MTISAKIVLDSVSRYGKRFTTFELKYPRFIHSEFMTHRVFSRNAASSRAIPVNKMIDDILKDTAMPIHWGMNQPGMQAKEECNNRIFSPELMGLDDTIDYTKTREEMWYEARDRAIEIAKEMIQANYHKQIVNRLLEPFMHIRVVASATEFDNFFELRAHPDAQPEFQDLAYKMQKLYNLSKPTLLYDDEWHLPYILEDEQKIYDINTLKQISIARCASVSYKTVDDKILTPEKAKEIYDKLIIMKPSHASPMEHQALPDFKIFDEYSIKYNDWANPKEHGNLVGWRQLRKIEKI